MDEFVLIVNIEVFDFLLHIVDENTLLNFKEKYVILAV